MTQYAFFFDQNRCYNCHACVVACRDWNDIQPGPVKWLRLLQWEKGVWPTMRMNTCFATRYHCENPVCVDACQHHALFKEGELCSLNAYYDDVVIPVPAWNSGMKTVTFRGWQVTGGREIYERYLKMISLGKFDPTPLATHSFHGFDQMEECLWKKKERECLKPVCLID